MNITPVNLINSNFCAQRKSNAIPYGIDYSSIDEFKRNDFSKNQLATAAIDGRLTQEMIDEMILDRIPKTLKHAAKFTMEHPEFEKDEVAQQLVSYVVELAHKYKGQQGGNFNNHAYHNERYFLEVMAKRHGNEQDWQEVNADIRNIKDNQLDLDLRDLLARDVQDSVSTLDTWEEDVIRKRYGLDGDEAKTLEVCADEFGVSAERVRQIERAAIRKLTYPYRLYDILEDISYINNGDDLDKRALLIDRSKF